MHLSYTAEYLVTTGILVALVYNPMAAAHNWHDLNRWSRRGRPRPLGFTVYILWFRGLDPVV